MVARRFAVRHENSTFDVDCDTDDGLEVFKIQLFSLTSIPPDEQKIVCLDDNKIVSDDSDLILISDKLCLMSINDQAIYEAESSSGNSHVNEELIKSDEELARMLQAEEEALLLQQDVAKEDNGQMEQRIRPYVDQVLMYEDPNYQEAARKTVHIVELEERALVALAKKDGNFEPTKVEQDHTFLLELLFWFKQSFSWVNAPPCYGCGNQTINQGMGAALPEEIRWGGSRIELYRCSVCLRITRFPRYNNPMKLLETRKGRCGEWANCFTLYCRAFGYESRLPLPIPRTTYHNASASSRLLPQSRPIPHFKSMVVVQWNLVGCTAVGCYKTVNFYVYIKGLDGSWFGAVALLYIVFSYVTWTQVRVSDTGTCPSVRLSYFQENLHIFKKI